MAEQLKDLKGEAYQKALREIHEWQRTHVEIYMWQDFHLAPEYLAEVCKKNRIIFNESGKIIGHSGKYYKTQIRGGANNVYMNALAQAIVEKRLKCQAHADNRWFKWHNRLLAIRPLVYNKLKLGYIIIDKNAYGYIVYDEIHNVISVNDYKTDIDVFIEDDRNLVAFYDTAEGGFVSVRTYRQIGDRWDVSDHAQAQLSYLKTLKRETDKDKIISIKSLILHEYEKII